MSVDSRDSNESFPETIRHEPSTCTCLSKFLSYYKCSADFDDAFLTIAAFTSMFSWICSLKYLRYDESFFVEYNTPSMWIYFCFIIVILSVTLVRLLWKVSNYKYDASTTIRKITFVTRCVLSMAIGILLKEGEMKTLEMGTHKMVRLCNILVVIDFSSWIVDCCLHWALYGFPTIFRTFLCNGENINSNSNRIYVPLPIQPRV
eukprot:247378_1